MRISIGRSLRRKTESLPVVVFNRGSYVRDDFTYEVLMLANRLAHEGYLVIAPMLRGSGGARGHDEMGGADLHDLINVVAVIKEIPYADSTRLFLYGESRGGIMSLLAAKHDFPARAIAVWGAITDLGSFLAEDSPRPETRTHYLARFSRQRGRDCGIPVGNTVARKINIPVLLMNGGADGQYFPAPRDSTRVGARETAQAVQAEDLLRRRAYLPRAGAGTR